MTEGRILKTRRSVESIILDTNVVSEVIKPQPNPLVSAWYLRQKPEATYTTAVTLAETLLGLGIMPHGRRRDTLMKLTYAIFEEAFHGRVLPFDEPAARRFGPLRSEGRRRGRPLEPIDAQIAAIALANGFSLATHNTSDFEHCGVPLINPWLP